MYVFFYSHFLLNGEISYSHLLLRTWWRRNLLFTIKSKVSHSTSLFSPFRNNSAGWSWLLSECPPLSSSTVLWPYCPLSDSRSFPLSKSDAKINAFQRTEKFFSDLFIYLSIVWVNPTLPNTTQGLPKKFPSFLPTAPFIMTQKKRGHPFE